MYFRYEEYLRMITSKFSFLAEKEEVSLDSPIAEIVGYIEIMNRYKKEVSTLVSLITVGNADFYKEELVLILRDIQYVDEELAKFNNHILQLFVTRNYPLAVKK